VLIKHRAIDFPVYAERIDYFFPVPIGDHRSRSRRAFLKNDHAADELKRPLKRFEGCLDYLERGREPERDGTARFQKKHQSGE